MNGLCSKIRCPTLPLKPYNQNHMEPTLSARIPDGLFAAMPLGGQKPHQGLSSRNPALYQGPTVCNSTTALGLRGQAELNRIGSRCTSKERDTESGNDYFMARYYNSAMGRFMSPDWSEKAEPVPYAQLAYPQSLNLYSYVRNNPLSRVDADGHWDCSGANAKGVGCQAMAKLHAAEGIVINAFNNTMKKDVTKFKNSQLVKVEAGFGLKAKFNVGPVDLQAGVTLHDEKSFSQTPAGSYKSDGPITDKLEGDVGATVGSAGYVKNGVFSILVATKLLLHNTLRKRVQWEPHTAEKSQETGKILQLEFQRTP
jgi:RHS repeat-associated protein